MDQFNIKKGKMTHISGETINKLQIIIKPLQKSDLNVQNQQLEIQTQKRISIKNEFEDFLRRKHRNSLKN